MSGLTQQSWLLFTRASEEGEVYACSKTRDTVLAQFWMCGVIVTRAGSNDVKDAWQRES